MTLSIQNQKGEAIVGFLNKRAENNKLVLLVHGDQGHKDSLYQAQLAEKLPINNFRFDLHGRGWSEGCASYGCINEDVDDIHTVAKYFEGQGYEIYAIVAYGRGSLSGLKYATTCDKPLAHFINIAAPYTNKETKLGLDENNGWKTFQNDKWVSLKVTDEQIKAFNSWDNSHVSHMPKTTCVHTIHGINDQIVPAYHAAMYANTIPSHMLTLVPDADHLFDGKEEELVQIVIDYFEKHTNDAYVKAVMMGQHVSLCIPRWIDIPGVKNFRDIGGWPLKDGSGYIRERIVFRCGHLVGITQEGIDTLHRLNVIAAFDFRSDPEVEKQGDMPPIEGLTRYPSAMFTKADYSPAALASRWKGYFEGAKGFPKVYSVILEKGASQYSNIFKHLINNHSITSTKSIIVHCTAGKDRTGIFGMLLLGLCGVDEDIIAHEYALSNLGYWEPEHELEKKAEMLGATLDDVRMVMSAPYMAMKETIQLVKDKYGSIEDYIRNECKLSSQEIEKLKSLMIVPIRFEERQLFRPKI